MAGVVVSPAHASEPGAFDVADVGITDTYRQTIYTPGGPYVTRTTEPARAGEPVQLHATLHNYGGESMYSNEHNMLTMGIYLKIEIPDDVTVQSSTWTLSTPTSVLSQAGCPLRSPLFAKRYLECAIPAFHGSDRTYDVYWQMDAPKDAASMPFTLTVDPDHVLEQKYYPTAPRTATVDWPVSLPNLQVGISADPMHVETGGHVTYVVTARNVGAVETFSSFPLHVELDTTLSAAGVDSASGGTCSYTHPTLLNPHRTVDCTFSALPAGGSASVVIGADAPATTGTVYATATVDAPGLFGGPGAVFESDEDDNLAGNGVFVDADLTPPVVTASVDPAPGASGWSTASPTVTLSASDARSGVASLTYTAIGAQAATATTSNTATVTVPVTAEGTTTFSVTATDHAGNVSAPGGVTVRYDAAAPTIACPTADPTWHSDNVTVTCTADDRASGLADPTQSQVALSTSVSLGSETAAAATGTVLVCDVAGLCATAGPVTGLRVDRKPPTVTCDPPPLSWQAANIVLSCTATDAGSGLASVDDVAFTLKTSIGAGTETASASTDTRQVCDQAGNCTTAGPYTGLKIDRLAPAVTCDPADTAWHAANVTMTCSATDNGSGLTGPTTLTLSTDVAAGTETATAQTNTATVCDGVGNCATAGPVTGNRIDRRGPDITIRTPTTGRYLLHSSVPADYSCVDGGSGIATCAGAVPNGSPIDTDAVGPHQLTITGTDHVGNATSTSVTYQVVYPFTGFLSPLSTSDTTVLNIANSGSAIPVRFSLGGNQGLAVLAAGSPSSAAISCSSTAATDPVEETVAATTSSLTYDAASDTYTYVWKTDKAWAHTCRRLSVKLVDGTTHTADFNFTR